MDTKTIGDRILEDYQKKQYEIERLKRTYYDSDENLILPRHSRYYYDYLGSRYQSITMEQKLRDLGFLVSQGFDLKRSIREYKVDREKNITDAIPQTFVYYILYMRYGEYHHFSEFVLDKLSESKLIKLFMDEIKLRFNPAEHEVILRGWNDDELLKAADGDKDTFYRLVTGVEWTKGRI